MTLAQFCMHRAAAQEAHAVLAGEVFDDKRTARALEWFEAVEWAAENEVTPDADWSDIRNAFKRLTSRQKDSK